MNRFVRTRQAERSPPIHSAGLDTRIIVQTSDSWSARLSYWAQVATLAVVIFGYFYTIRPAFQNQLVQEQAAQLTLDNQAATERLKATQTLQAAAEGDLDNLRSQQKDLENSLLQAKAAETDLRSELSRAQIHSVEAASNTAKAVASLNANKNTIEQEQRRILVLYFAALVFAKQTDDELADIQAYMDAYSSRFYKDADGSFIIGFQATWPNAFDEIHKILESAERKEGSGAPWVSKLLADEYDNKLTEQKNAFSCTPPDLAAMRSKFLSDVANLEPGVEQSLRDEVARMRAEERNPLVKLRFRVEPKSAEVFKKVKRSEGISRLASGARAEIIKLHRECRAKEMAFIALFQQLKK